MINDRPDINRLSAGTSAADVNLWHGSTYGNACSCKPDADVQPWLHYWVCNCNLSVA